MSSTVSVVVPVFNSGKWLAGAIKSILDQSYLDLDIILVDDGSTDDSTEICSQYARLDERVFAVHTLNHGASSARNSGLKRARGEFILFCDADDYLEPGAIGKLVEAIDGAHLACGSFRKFGLFETVVKHPTETLDLTAVSRYAMGNLRNPRSNQMLSGCWAKLYRSALVGWFPDLVTAEDMAFNYEYLSRCNVVRFISDIVYNNQKRTSSLSMSFDEKNKSGLFGFLEGLKYIRRFLQQFYSGDELEDALDNSKVYHSMLYFSRMGPDALKKMFPLENKT